MPFPGQIGGALASPSIKTVGRSSALKGLTTRSMSSARRLGKFGLIGGGIYGAYRFGKRSGASSGANGLIPNSSGGMGAANIRGGTGYGVYGY